MQEVTYKISDQLVKLHFGFKEYGMRFVEIDNIVRTVLLPVTIASARASKVFTDLRQSGIDIEQAVLDAEILIIKKQYQ